MLIAAGNISSYYFAIYPVFAGLLVLVTAAYLYGKLTKKHYLIKESSKQGWKQRNICDSDQVLVLGCALNYFEAVFLTKWGVCMKKNFRMGPWFWAHLPK